MIEIYLAGAAAVAVGFLWMRNKVLKKQRDAQEARAESAENIASHNAAVAMTERKRDESREKRIKEAVDHAEANDFSDFYDD